ncbi:MAG: WD40/YVTN/BNR-like repeat-containing protein [Thermoanaerobaculaceae bacterium]
MLRRLLVATTVLVATLPAHAQQGTWFSSGPEGGGLWKVVVDPRTPTTVYAAGSAGVWKSWDGGASWSASSTGLSHLSVRAFALEPTNPQVLYAGGWNSGVTRSVDGGATWTAANTGLPADQVSALAVHPTASGTVFVGIPGSGAFKSTDGGAHWNPTGNQISGNTRIYAFAFHPTASQTVWAGSNTGLYVSTDGGTVWTKVAGFTSADAIQTLAIDPTNPAVMYAGTENGGAFKSTNGGTTWTPINTGMAREGRPATTVEAIVIDPSDHLRLLAGTEDGGAFLSTNGGTLWSPTVAGFPLTDVKGLAFSPGDPTTVYAATGGAGVFKSTSAGAAWAQANQGLRAADVEDVVVDTANPTRVWAATLNGVWRSSDRGVSWTSATGDLPILSVETLAVDPANPGVAYATTWHGVVLKTTDGGTHWTRLAGGVPDAYAEALAINPANSSQVYLGCTQGLFRSTNGGSTWTKVGIGGTDRRILSIRFDPTNAGMLYVGTWNGLFRSPDGGTTWYAPTLASESIWDIAVNPGAPQQVWVCSYKGVYRSTDGGSTFAGPVGGFAEYYWTLALDPQQGNTVYVGGSGGVYRSTDGGQSFAPFGGSFGDFSAYGMAFQPGAWTLHVGSSAMGVQVTPPPAGACTPPRITSHPQGTTIAAGATATLSVTATGTAPLRYQWYQGNSGTMASPVAGATSAAFTTPALGSTASYWVNVSNTCGFVGSATATVTVGPGQALRYIVPSVAHSPGAGGTQWRTDVAAVNNGAVAASMTLVYTNYDGSQTVQRTHPLPAGQAVEWQDVLTTLFSVSTSTSTKGTLRVESDQPVVLNARTYNQAGNGTYGQRYPALTAADAIPAGGTGVIGQLKKTVNARTNIGAVNLGPTPAVVKIRLFGSTGAQVGNVTTLNLPAFRWLQQDDIFTSAGAGSQAPAYATVTVETAGAAVWAYGSVIDATTGDPTTLPITGTFSQAYVPSVAHAPGSGGTQWRTDVAAVNRGANAATLTLDFTNYDASSTKTRTVPLAAGATVELVDLLTSLFNYGASENQKGTLRVASTRAVHLTSRTYNQAAKGTYGQYYPALGAGQAIEAGKVGVIPQLRKNASYRTNIGVQNLGTSSVLVDVKLHGASGAQLGKTRTFNVPGGRWLQQDDIFVSSGAGNAEVAYATVEVRTAGGMVWAYGSVIDARTGDPTTIPAL